MAFQVRPEPIDPTEDVEAFDALQSATGERVVHLSVAGDFDGVGAFGEDCKTAGNGCLGTGDHFFERAASVTDFIEF